MRWELTFVLLKVTLSEWISSVARYACARWQMIDDLANGVQTAGSRARIFAFVVYARKTGGAIRVQHTFRSTTLVRISKVIRDASASAGSVLFFAYSVSSTRTW
jgi:hypothetical protein